MGPQGQKSLEHLSRRQQRSKRARKGAAAGAAVGVGAGVAMVAMGEKKQNKRDGAVDNKGRDLEESEISALGEDGIFLPGSPMATNDLPYSRKEQAKILGPGFESSDSDEDDVHIRKPAADALVQRSRGTERVGPWQHWPQNVWHPKCWRVEQGAEKEKGYH